MRAPLAFVSFLLFRLLGPFPLLCVSVEAISLREARRSVAVIRRHGARQLSPPCGAHAVPGHRVRQAQTLPAGDRSDAMVARG